MDKMDETDLNVISLEYYHQTNKEETLDMMKS